MSDCPFDAALAPPRAFGAPVGRGRVRVAPEDFVVEEDLGFASGGAGSHALLKVRKRNANTEWVARELARIAGCRSGDVGYAGLKDRRSVAIQWFSVPLRTGKARDTASTSAAPNAGAQLAELCEVRRPDFEVLEAHAHARKLPRGALAGNRFTIRVRDLDVPEAALAERLQTVGREGVPNYFGLQRFGRDGANLHRIAPDPKAIHPRERTFVLSAARSLIFNAVLAERVLDGSWRELEAGDVANLDARGSIFPVDAVDDALRNRLARLEIHATGPMWGQGELPTRARVRDLEQRIAASYEVPCALVAAAGMRQERRSLRLAVRNLEWTREGTDLVLRFWLTKGSFATAVLREVFAMDDALEIYE